MSDACGANHGNVAPAGVLRPTTRPSVASGGEEFA